MLQIIKVQEARIKFLAKQTDNKQNKNKRD